VTFKLRAAQVAGTQSAVENLVLSGVAPINGFSNDLDNVISGNAAGNVLAGFAGNDELFGGGRADTFEFRSAPNASNNVDTITDYNVAQDTTSSLGCPRYAHLDCAIHQSENTV